MSAIETRLFSGDATPADAEWLDWLNEVFGDLSIPEFAAVGMDAANVRRLLAVKAMMYRVHTDLDQAA